MYLEEGELLARGSDFRFQASSPPLPDEDSVRATWIGAFPTGPWLVVVSAEPANASVEGPAELAVRFGTDTDRGDDDCSPPDEGLGPTDWARMTARRLGPDRCVLVLNLTEAANDTLAIHAAVMSALPGGTVVTLAAAPASEPGGADGVVDAPDPCTIAGAVVFKQERRDAWAPNPWTASPDGLRGRGLWNLGAALAHPTACYELGPQERAAWDEVRAQVERDGLDPRHIADRGEQWRLDVVGEG